MSHVIHWSESPEGGAFDLCTLPRQSHPLAFSLAVAVIAMAISGAAIAWRWQQYEAVDTAAIADTSPVQVSLPPEDFADAQVVHGRLVVLTPPVYAQPAGPMVTLMAREDMPQTAEALTRDSVTPEPESEPEAPAEIEAQIDADPTPAETIGGGPAAERADDSF
ncbi:MAG TPA: hypothetical protein VG839_06980 [Asticcacaulis sp.]|nr:hypothetical protein [Asticcacaulis sp.]